MEVIFQQLREFPIIALFLSLGIGFLVGKFKVGKFVLGGVAGTLIVGVVVGQVGGIQVSSDIKGMFFSLFIFMVGYLGGPQFFASLKPSAFKYLIAAVGMTVLGLLTVLGVSIWAGLDAGLAAGLAAGGLTQSAIIGTAGDAINNLGLAADTAKDLKTNVAVGYSITYIFGSIGPILAVGIIPIIMKWDLKKAAIDLAAKMGGSGNLGEGEFTPLTRVNTRAFESISTSKFANSTIKEIEDKIGSDLTIERVIIDNKGVEPDPNMTIKTGNILFVTGLVSAFSKIGNNLGNEIAEFGENIDFTEEARKVTITNKKLRGITLKQLRETATASQRHGVYISDLRRLTNPIPVLDGTEIHLGDEILLVGRKKDLDRVQKLIGHKSPSINTTEFVTLGLALVAGYLIGEISFRIGGTAISLGSGLGCLISGLIFGFLRTRHPKVGAINIGAAKFLQSFGLAVFVGIVGINAGEPALAAIKEHGVTLLLLGVVVTLLPLIIQFILNYKIFKIKEPITALGVLTGSKSANPGFASLLDAAGNSTPTPSFTMTYAVANIFLTLWGPIIIAIISNM